MTLTYQIGESLFRYLKAFIKVAQQENVFDVIQKDLNDLSVFINHAALKEFITNPTYIQPYYFPAFKKIVQQCHFHPLTVNFLCLLFQKKHLHKMHQIVHFAPIMCAQAMGKKIVTIILARPLDSATKAKLQTCLSDLITAPLFFIEKINAHLLAGMVILIDSYQFDFSFHTYLKKMTFNLKEKDV